MLIRPSKSLSSLCSTSRRTSRMRRPRSRKRQSSCDGGKRSRLVSQRRLARQLSVELIMAEAPQGERRGAEPEEEGRSLGGYRPIVDGAKARAKPMMRHPTKIAAPRGRPQMRG